MGRRNHVCLGFETVPVKATVLSTLGGVGSRSWRHEPGESRRQVRPPSDELAAPRRSRIQRTPSSKASIPSKYWLAILPQTESFAVVAPIESVITRHVAP